MSGLKSLPRWCLILKIIKFSGCSHPKSLHSTWISAARHSRGHPGPAELWWDSCMESSREEKERLYSMKKGKDTRVAKILCYTTPNFSHVLYQTWSSLCKISQDSGAEGKQEISECWQLLGLQPLWFSFKITQIPSHHSWERTQCCCHIVKPNKGKRDRATDHSNLFYPF